ncbi:MAG: hypothetical protein PSN34_12950 [Urechidicola sp.]|nr:hypothetical protein [Urechidicola sp.]
MKHQAPSTKHQAPSTKHQAPSTKLNLTNYFKPYLVLICLSLLLFNCDTDEVIEESVLEETQEDNISNISIKTIDFNEISTNNKVLEKIEYIKGRNDKYNTLSREIHNEEYEFSFNTDYVKYIEYGDYHSYSFPLTREAPENDHLENLFLSLNIDGEYDAFIVKYDFSAEELISLTEEELNSGTTQYTPIDFDSSFLNESNTTERYICVQAWDYVNCTVAWFGHGDGDECVPGWVSYWECTFFYEGAGNGAGTGYGTGGDTSNEGDPSGEDGNTGGGTTGSGSDGDPYYYITTPVVLSNEDQILYCLGPLDGGFDYTVWLDDPTTPRSDIKNLANYLTENGCSAEVQSYAMLTIEVLMNSSEVDLLPGVFKDPTFVDSQLDCIYKKLKRDSSTDEKTFFDTMLETFDTWNSPLTFSIGTTPTNDYAFTKGEVYHPYPFGDTMTTFDIISSPSAEAASNLDKMVTLSHEVMHAFMFRSLEEWGIISFTSEGKPQLVQNYLDMCQDDDLDEETDINTLTMQERWVFLICEILENSAIPSNNEQWSHSLFETPVFVLETYREKLEQLLLTKHDWNSEPTSTKNDMISHFGTNWKQKVAEYMSWSGLEKTPEFTVWAATQASFLPSTFSDIPNNGLTIYEEFAISITNYWTNLDYTGTYSNDNCN